MNREEFLSEIQRRLRGLPQEDIDERIAFYKEIIEDRMEEGLTEEEAVKEIGTVNSVVNQIMNEKSSSPKTKKLPVVLGVILALLLLSVGIIHTSM